MPYRPAAAPATGRRPRDLYGLPLTTTPEAADAYNQGLDRYLRVQTGAEQLIGKAVQADPGFALGHAALALLGHAGAADTDVPAALDAARSAARSQLDDRESSFVDAVAVQVSAAVGDGPGATPRLLRHIRAFPRDALSVNVAVPTITSNGITQGEQAWALVESLAPVYGEDPWYLGQLAFVRQEQNRWREAAALADRALDADPAAGHAVHARAHVMYETGEHRAGLDWLETWLHRHGPDAFHAVHFSWHAALHELMLDDPGALRRRYDAQLAPPGVTGCRALIDSGSLLWRCHVTERWRGPLPGAAVLDAAPEGWLDAPPTAFAALHSALALAATDDADRLRRLRQVFLGRAQPVFHTTLAGLCEGLAAVVEQRWDRAADLLAPLLPRLGPLGGSAAQREVVEETLLHALARAGRNDEAARLLSARLDRRPAALDRNRILELAVNGGTYPTGGAG
jgi:tetratricopeptide (TPR) repeat protein